MMLVGDREAFTSAGTTVACSNPSAREIIELVQPLLVAIVPNCAKFLVQLQLGAP